MQTVNLNLLGAAAVILHILQLSAISLIEDFVSWSNYSAYAQHKRALVSLKLGWYNFMRIFDSSYSA